MFQVLAGLRMGRVGSWLVLFWERLAVLAPRSLVLGVRYYRSLLRTAEPVR